MNQAEHPRPLRILHLEDNRHDLELAAETLAADGLQCALSNAATQKEFASALAGPAFDLILADFTLPSFDGHQALTAAKKAQPEVPFLFLSGTIGEERAVESLKAGATDCVLKEHLSRLPGAVRRALREAAEIAQRKQLEEQLRQAQKMEAIGQLAGGIAHDFNNLLTVIKGNCEVVLLATLELSPEARECLRQVTAAVDRAANLTRQLLAFGRRQVMQPALVSVNEVIGNLAKMLGRIIGEHIRLECGYHAQPAFVEVDVGMLEQVIMNLVVNARDAMPKGGVLSITTETIDINQQQARRQPDARPGQFVRLSVRDTGTGIAPEHLARIFEPFFTTKEAGRGTGLGLATVYGIIKQHQGWIEVSSELDRGSVFHVWLPAMAPPLVQAPNATRQSRVRGGKESILLVEDDEALRSLTRRLLENLGYQVYAATSGQAALKLWQELTAPLDLLLTDVILPDGLTGRELARKLTSATPSLKVILTSGYASEPPGDRLDPSGSGNSFFLAKPYSTQALAETVRRCLDGQ